MDSPGPGSLVWAEWRQRIASRSAAAQQRWRSGWQPRLRRLFAALPDPAPKFAQNTETAQRTDPAQTADPVPKTDTALKTDPAPQADLALKTDPSPQKNPAPETEPAPNAVPAPAQETAPSEQKSETTPTTELAPKSEPGPNSELETKSEPERTSEPQTTRESATNTGTVQSEQDPPLSYERLYSGPAIPELLIDRAADTEMMATDAAAESSDGSESRASAIEPSLRSGSAPMTPLLTVPETPDSSSPRRSPLTVQDWVDSLPATPCPREVSGGGEGSDRRAALAREASLASEAGSQSSVESLLGLRRADPEEVLLGLGFGGANNELDDDLARIPRRFLRPSQVRGVAIHDFLRHQHDLVHTFESGSLGYRGLVGPGSRPASGIVGKIMEKLRGQRAPFASAPGNARFAAAARRVINTLPVTVLSPGNRQYLDQQGGKSPEVPRKRMVIGQRSFAFDREGHLIDLGSDSGGDGAGSSLSRSDTLGSEPLARRLSYPATPDAPPPTPSTPDAPPTQRRRRSLKRQPRIDDQDETSPERSSEPSTSLSTSTPLSRATRLELAADSSLELSELSLDDGTEASEASEERRKQAARESLGISEADGRRLEAIEPELVSESIEPAVETLVVSPSTANSSSKWRKRDSESMESSPRSLEWDSVPMDLFGDRRDSRDSLYLRERAAMHHVPQLRILVDTVVERHSAESRIRPVDGRPDDGRPDDGRPEEPENQRPDSQRPDSGMSEGSPRDAETQDLDERVADVSVWDDSMIGETERDTETDADWALGRGGGRLQVLPEESEFGSDTNSVSSSMLEEALTAGDNSAARRARLAGLGPSDSSGFSDQEDSMDQLSQELKRRGVEPGACAAKAALAAFGAALGCAAGCTACSSDLREACPDLRQLRELRDAVAAQLRRVADLVDEQPDGVASVTAQIAELLRRQSRLARLPDACAASCCDGLLGVRDAHRNLESLVQRNSRELAEIRRLLQQLLPAQSQS